MRSFFQEKPVTKVVLTTIWLLLISTGFAAEKSVVALDKKLKLKKQTYLLKELMSEVAKQCAVGIAYDSKKISSTSQIKVTKTGISTLQLLILMKQQTGICHKERGNYIILLPKFTKRIFRKKKIKTLVEMPSKVDSLSAPEIVPVKKDSVLAPKNGVPIIEYVIPERKPEIYYPTIPAYVRAVMPYDTLKPKPKFFDPHFEVEAGLLANEIFYLAPTASVGFRYLSLTGAIYKNGSQTLWRMGMQSTVQLNEKWSLSAGYQFGQPIKASKRDTETSSRHYEYLDTLKSDSIVVVDTTIYTQSVFNFSANGKWSTINVSVKYALSSSISLNGGITYNTVKNTYLLNDSPVSDPTTYYSADRLPTTIRPPYTLSKKNPETQRWIGVQVSLVYRF